VKAVRRALAAALFVGLLYLGWGFVHGNDEPVAVDFVLGRFPAVPLWKALLGAAALGAAGVALWASFAVLRARLEARRFRKELARLEQEVQPLRSQSALADDAPPGEEEIAAVQGEGVAGRR
jgi:uncharacterized integral membrane protein